VRIGNAIYTLHKQRVYYIFSHFLNTRISVFAFFIIPVCMPTVTYTQAFPTSLVKSS